MCSYCLSYRSTYRVAISRRTRPGTCGPAPPVTASTPTRTDFPLPVRGPQSEGDLENGEPNEGGPDHPDEGDKHDGDGSDTTSNLGGGGRGAR